MIEYHREWNMVWNLTTPWHFLCFLMWDPLDQGGGQFTFKQEDNIDKIDISCPDQILKKWPLRKWTKTMQCQYYYIAGCSLMDHSRSGQRVSSYLISRWLVTLKLPRWGSKNSGVPEVRKTDQSLETASDGLHSKNLENTPHFLCDFACSKRIPRYVKVHFPKNYSLKRRDAKY